MQASQLEIVRRSKLTWYAELLPDASSQWQAVDVVDDVNYARILSDVANTMPSGFGLQTGQRRRLADLGVLGQATLGCRNLKEVLDLWIVFSQGAGELVTLSSRGDELGEDWLLMIEPYAWLSEPVVELVSDELCAAFFRLAQEITGRHFLDFTVHLPHARRHKVDYKRAFPGRIVFESSLCGLCGPTSALELPVVPRRQDQVVQILKGLGWSADAIHQRSETLTKIHNFFVWSAGSDDMTIAAAAASLGVSQRTLVRYLTAEGTTFGALLDEFRRNYTFALMRYGGFKPKQIAYMVGFKSENGLRKAFKKWEGVPIGKWESSVLSSVEFPG